MQGQLLGTPAYMAPEQARGRARPGRPADRHLRPGRDPLRDPHRPAAVRRAQDLRDHPQGLQRGPDPAPTDRPGDRARPGGRLPEGPEQRAGRPLPDGVRAGPGGPALPGRRAGQGVSRALDQQAAALGAAAQGRRSPPPPGCCHRDGRPGRQHRLGLPASGTRPRPRASRHARPSTCSPRSPTSLSTTSSTRSRRSSSRTPWPITRSSPAGPPATRRCGWSTAGPTSRWATSSASWAGCPTRRPPIARRSSCSSRWPAARRRARARSSRWPGPAPCWATSWSAAGPTRARPTPLYSQALEAQHVLADAQTRPGRDHRGPPPPGPDLEEPGRPAAARRPVRAGQAGLRPGHRRARAGAWPPTPSKPRPATSWRWPSTPAAGSTASWATSTAAEKDFRRAVELLEKLVAEFPTVPRHRESLAKALQQPGLAREGHRPARRRRDPPAPRAAAGEAAGRGLPRPARVSPRFWPGP